MYEYRLQTASGRKAEFFDFYHRSIEEVGALDLAELRDLIVRGGIDPFEAGWVIGAARLSLISDGERRFLLPEREQVGWVEMPSPRPGYAAHFDAKRAEFERNRPAWTVGGS